MNGDLHFQLLKEMEASRQATPFYNAMLNASRTIKYDNDMLASKHIRHRWYNVSFDVICGLIFSAYISTILARFSVFFAEIMSIITMMVCIIFPWKHKKRKIAKLTDELNTSQQTYDEAIDNIVAIWRKGPKTVPLVYWDEWTLNTLIKYVYYGRADTLKEAINLFEQERFQQKQAEKLGQIASSQNQISDQIEDLKREVRWNTIITSY